jgi:hypothetical protein
MEDGEDGLITEFNVQVSAISSCNATVVIECIDIV